MLERVRKKRNEIVIELIRHPIVGQDRQTNSVFFLVCANACVFIARHMIKFVRK